MGHAALVLPYASYGRRAIAGSIDRLHNGFALVGFGLPLFASYYVPWWVWWYEDLSFKPAVLVFAVSGWSIAYC